MEPHNCEMAKTRITANRICPTTESTRESRKMAGMGSGMEEVPPGVLGIAAIGGWLISDYRFQVSGFRYKKSFC